MNIIQGAGHVWQGGDGTDGYNRHKHVAEKPKRRNAVRCWHAITDPTGGRYTDDQLDYLRCGLRMSADELNGDLRMGNIEDGLYIANDTTGAVYRVTGGKLLRTQWRLG